MKKFKIFLIGLSLTMFFSFSYAMNGNNKNLVREKNQIKKTLNNENNNYINQLLRQQTNVINKIKDRININSLKEYSIEQLNKIMTKLKPKVYQEKLLKSEMKAKQKNVEDEIKKIFGYDIESKGRIMYKKVVFNEYQEEKPQMNLKQNAKKNNYANNPKYIFPSNISNIGNLHTNKNTDNVNENRNNYNKELKYKMF